MLIKKGQMELVSGLQGNKRKVEMERWREERREGGRKGWREGDSPCIHCFTALTSQSIKLLCTHYRIQYVQAH